MKKYKHKKTGNIAFLENPFYRLEQNSAAIIPKYLIENSNDWEEVIEKDFEILKLSLRGDVKAVVDNKVCHTYSSITLISVEKALEIDYKIHSVHRKSDGEVFTIEDKVKLYHHNQDAQKITNFELVNNQIKLNFECKQCTVLLQNAKKEIVKTPLFTSADGFQIFNNNKYFELYDFNGYNERISERIAVKDGDEDYNCGQAKWYFSTKEAAENYRILNKPCLSINDIATIYTSAKHTSHPQYPQAEKLRNLVKSKLNQ